MKKIVITGASTYGVLNHGDDAMLLNLVQCIKKHYPKCAITFIARHPNKSYDKYFGFKSIKNIDHDNRKLSIGRFFYGFNTKDKDKHLIKIKNEIESADLLIIGGNSFMEVSENSFLRGVSSYATTLAILCKFLGVPYALYGLNVVEHIKSRITMAHASFLVSNASAVTVRGKKGLNLLKKVNLSSYSNIKVFADPAYGIDFKFNNSIAKNLLLKNGIDINYNEKIIGLCFRAQYWLESEKEINNNSKLIAKFIDKIISLTNANILMIPNCTYDQVNKWQNDRNVHNLIKNYSLNKNKIFKIDKDLSIYETITLFSLISLHITNRRHSAIFAALHHVPFLVFSVSHKFHLSPILKELKLKNQMIGVKDSLQNKISAFLNTWNNIETLKKNLIKIIPKLTKTSRDQVTYLLKKKPIKK